MPYIGRSTITGNYIKCSTLTPDGSTTTFTLTNSIDSANVYPGSENSMIVSVSGVIQAPGSAYTINNNQITFSEAPGVSDTIDFIIVLGDLVSIGTPSDGTVTSAKLATGSVSTAKLADSAVTAAKVADNTLTLAKLSATGTKDATTFLRGDNSFVAVTTDLVNDTTPQLGGALDINSQEITGSLIPSTTDTYDLGSLSKVWANIYTGDLNLSNEAKDEGNSVDGTKGNWTIQEGAEDLFLINNNSGKKYKFTLEEI